MSKKIKDILIKYLKALPMFILLIINDIGILINTLYEDIKKILKLIYTPIIFISGLGRYIFNSIKTYSEKTPLKSIGKCINKIITTVFTDLSKIIKFLYSPVIIIASIGNNFSKTIENYSKNNKNDYINKFENFIKEKEYELFPRRDRRRFERLKRRLFFAKNETFLNSNIYGIVFLTTFGLQCISFFTTFRGSLTFFEGVHWSAPLIFTSILQLLLLVLANIAFSKRRRFFGRKVMVCVLCCISIFLSYIGISNSVITPSEFYKTQYETFKSSYETVYDLVETKTTAINFDLQIESIFNKVETAKQNAESQISILQSEINADRSVQKTNYQRDPEGGYIAIDNSSNYITAREKIAENEKKISSIESVLNTRYMNSIDQIKNEIKGIDLSILNNATNYSDTLNELQKNNQTAFNDYTNLIDDYISLINLPAMSEYVTSSSISNDLLDLIGYAAISMNIDNIKLAEFSDLENKSKTSCDEIDSSKPNSAKEIYNFLLQGTERPQFVNYLYDNIKNELNDKYNSIHETVNQFGNFSELSNSFASLENIYQKIDLKEPYTFALSHLFDIKSGYYLKILLMVFFAIIVDGLTVLIPILCEKRRESALFTKSSEDIMYDQEDVLENLLLSCAFPNPEDRKDLSKIMYDENLYYNMLNTLSEYIKLYEPSPFTIKLGFPKRLNSNLLQTNPSKKSNTEELEKRRLHKELTSFLMEMGYVKFVSKQEYYLLKCDYYNIEPIISEKGEKDAAKTEWELEQGYYLLKGNFILWMNDNRLAWLGRKHRHKKSEQQDVINRNAGE